MENEGQNSYFFNKKDSVFLIVLAGIIILFSLSSLYSSLLLHTLSDLFCIVISMAIFIIAWNSRDHIDNNFLLFIGIAYLFIGGLDFLNLLAYEGMNIFTGYGSNLSEQLWIAGRYLGAGTLLSAAFLISRKIDVYKELAAYTAIFIVLVTAIFSGIFPQCWIEGQPTEFSLISEYIITLTLVLAIFFLFRHRRRFKPRIFSQIILAIAFMALSSLSLAISIELNSSQSTVGLLLRIVAFALIYYALVETGIRRPYETIFRNLHEKEREAAEERDTLDMYINMSGALFLVLNTDRTVEKINDEGCQLLEYQCDEVIGKDFIENFIPEEQRVEAGRIFELIISGDIQQGEARENELVSKSGKIRTLLWENNQIKDDEGNIISILYSGEDITNRKEAEIVLHRTQFAFDHSPDEIYYVDHDGRIVYANLQAVKSLGIDLESDNNTTIYDINPEITQDKWKEIWLTLIKEDHYRFESVHMHQDGTTYPVDIIKYLITYGDEDYSCTIARNISEMKKSENALKESEGRLRTVLQSIPDMVWLKDTDGVFLTCNTKFENFVGFKEIDIKGKTDYDFVDKELADFFREGDRKAIEGNEPSISEELVPSAIEGREVFLETIKTPLYDSEGNVTGVLGIGRDISERKKSEDAIKEVNRKLNLLSSITRHDILNQITGAIGFLEIIELDDEIPHGTSTEKYIKKISGAVETIRRQIEFTGFYKDLGEQAPDWYDVGEIVKRVGETSSFGEIKLHNNIKDIRVFADPLFEKVIYNLIDNAIKHGDTITEISFYTEEKPEELVIFCEDDGIGIPEEFKEKIFRREYFKNSGLGLFLSGEILAITGLTIKETGTPGGGARFEIHVPADKFRTQPGSTGGDEDDGQ